MNYRIFQIALIAFAFCFTPEGKTSGLAFSDAFNRPDSPTVGNGWQNSTNNTPGVSLAIINNRLSATQTDSGAGVFRAFAVTNQVEIRAVITEHTGYGCLPKAYGTWFGIYNDGSQGGGYLIGFHRSDRNYDDSRIQLVDNGVDVGVVMSSFQFGSTVNIDFVRFNKDGSVQGRISQAGSSFDFAFGARSISSHGQNICILPSSADSRCGSPTHSTIDDFQIYHTGPPFITEQPHSQYVEVGQNAVFSVAATGAFPLNYQWRKGGVNIAGATNATLTLNSVTTADSGCYSVSVRNSLGPTESQLGCLAVLSDGANGANPTRITVPSTSRSPGKDSLVVVTHGFQGWGDLPDWLPVMTNSISKYLAARGSNNWQVVAYDWAERAGGVGTVKHNARVIGSRYGKQLASQQWEHIHLIAHSVGSKLIQEAAKEIKTSPTSAATIIHTTFLDAYVGLDSVERTIYGSYADWSDSYFSQDDNLIPPGRTEGSLANAHNVDVTWLDPDNDVYPIYCSPPMVIYDYLNPCGYRAVSSHAYPHDFYTNTIHPNLQAGSEGYGFPLSKEGGGWNNRSGYPRGNPPHVLGSSPPLPQIDFPIRADSPFVVANVPTATSSSGVIVDGNGFNLSSGSPQLALQKASSAGASVTEPAWLAIAILITNAVNLIQFESQFVAIGDAEGLLTVYWNTNQIGLVDEGVTSSGFETYRFELPAVVTNGIYTLSFRLDAFDATSSSIVVTNVTTGFVGLDERFTLTVIGSTNRAPTLQLTGAAGYNYLVQSTTNLIDWSPSVFLNNTNGTVVFTDISATNFSQKFYRALLR